MPPAATGSRRLKSCDSTGVSFLRKVSLVFGSRCCVRCTFLGFVCCGVPPPRARAPGTVDTVLVWGCNRLRGAGGQLSGQRWDLEEGSMTVITGMSLNVGCGWGWGSGGRVTQTGFPPGQKSVWPSREFSVLYVHLQTSPAVWHLPELTHKTQGASSPPLSTAQGPPTRVGGEEKGHALSCVHCSPQNNCTPSTSQAAFRNWGARSSLRTCGGPRASLLSDRASLRRRSGLLTAHDAGPSSR